MKHLKISGNLLTSLLLAGLLSSCHNDESITPPGQSAIEVNDENAKLISTPKLSKDGTRTLEYVALGRYAGKLSKVIEASHYTEYSYNDNNGSTDLWITSKRYANANNTLEHEIKYQIVNGKCISSRDATNNIEYDYIYNAAGRLVEIKGLQNGSAYKIVFDHAYFSATKEYRLRTITVHESTGPVGQMAFHYTGQGGTAIEDKYPLNPDIGLDRYLRIYGKFSDVLVQEITVSQLNAPNQPVTYTKLTYSTNADGYVTTRVTEYHPYGKGNNTNMQTTIDLLKY